MSDKGGLQLIPETRRKIEVSVPGENRMLYWGIGFLLVVGLAYGGLFAYASSLEQQLADINTQIDEQEKTRNYAREKEVITISKQLKSVSGVLDRHIYMSKGLERFKRNLQPQLKLTGLELGVSSGIFKIGGEIPSYTLAAEQIASFLADDAVKETRINGFKKKSEGIVEFGGEIVVNPAVYFE